MVMIQVVMVMIPLHGDDDTLTGGDGSDSFVLDAIFGDDTITDFDSSSDMIDLTAIVGATVSTDTNSDGDVTLTVEDSQGREQGTLTLEDVSIDDYRDSSLKYWIQLPLEKGGYQLYQNNHTEDVGVLANGIVVIILDSNGNKFTDPTSISSDTSQWFTEDLNKPGNYINIELDEIDNNEDDISTVTLPEWSDTITTIDGNNIYQDDNINSPTKKLLALTQEEQTLQ